MRKILLIIVCIVISNYSFGQRDTLIIHEKDSFKILENQFFDKNNELVKQVFSMEGKLLPSYFTKEDLFERGIKQTSKVTIYGIVLDSIKLYKDNQIIEKQYYQNNEKHNVILRQHLYQYDDNGILENIKVIKKELMFFSRTVFKRTETIRLSNKKIDEYRVVSTKKFYPYGYDTVIVNKDDASKREYHAYFPNGTIRQKRYETDRKLDSTITFRHDGTLMEKGFPYDDLDKRYIDGRIVHRYKPYENQPYEIDTINKFFNYLLPSSSIASESEKTEKRKGSTFVANNKLSSQLKMSTVDTAFAIGLRDSLFIYQRGDSKILEGRFYYKNGNIKKRVFEREKDFSTRYIDRSEYYEDLFQRNIKTSDSITYYARKLDEVILYHNDGRINEKWVDSERERFIYDENNELIGIQEIYRGQYKYAYKNKATTYFEPNQLLTLGGKYNFTYLNGITIKTRINEDLTIPFELVSHTEELVEFELISKNNIAYKSDKKVVNYGDTIIFNLNYNPTKSINNYQFTLQGKTADTTFNRNIDVNIEGYHFLTQADFDKNIRYELSTNNLVLYFEKGGGKLLRVYKNDVLKAEGSVSQIMNEISFKGYARGEYMLELIDLSTRQKDKMTLILK